MDLFASLSSNSKPEAVKRGKGTKQNGKKVPKKPQKEADSIKGARPMKTDVKTAVVLILEEAPNPELYSAVQSVRSRHDKAYDRWMPHLCLLYPFVPVADVSDAVGRLEQALRLTPLEPFTMSFGKVGAFTRGAKVPSTVFLEPDESSTKACAKLQEVVRQAFPGILGKHAQEFHPHLTLGQWPECEALDILAQADHKTVEGVRRWIRTSSGFPIAHIHVITRGADTPFTIAASIAIKTGAVSASKSTPPAPTTNTSAPASPASNVDAGVTASNSAPSTPASDSKVAATEVRPPASDSKVAATEVRRATGTGVAGVELPSGPIGPETGPDRVTGQRAGKDSAAQEVADEKDVKDFSGESNGGHAEDYDVVLCDQDAEFRWQEGDDPRDVWIITDEEQLKTIPLPDGNKMPCEARVGAIRAFMQRGLKITKLGLAWWLAFNVQLADQVEDLITIEEALDLAVKVKSAQMLMMLAEYSTEQSMTRRRENILEWYRGTAQMVPSNTNIRDARNAALLGNTLVEMGWVKETDLDPRNGPGAVPSALL